MLKRKENIEPWQKDCNNQIQMTVKSNIKEQETNSKDNLFVKTKLTAIKKKRLKPIQNQGE